MKRMVVERNPDGSGLIVNGAELRIPPQKKKVRIPVPDLVGHEVYLLTDYPTGQAYVLRDDAWHFSGECRTCQGKW